MDWLETECGIRAKLDLRVHVAEALAVVDVLGLVRGLLVFRVLGVLAPLGSRWCRPGVLPVVHFRVHVA